MKKYKMFLIIKDNSERVKKKNFREIEGKPLHQYFIDKRKSFDIFIDTDSDDIYNFYNQNENYPNIVVYKRSQSYIDMESNGNISPAPYMIERFLNEYIEDENESIVTSHITSPFIDDDTIIKALKYMNNHTSISSVKSVKEFSVDGVGEIGKPINFSLEKIVKTQSLQPIGILNGAFFIINKKTFLTNGLQRISNKHYYYPINDIEAMDIDTEFDLMIAKLYAENKQ